MRRFAAACLIVTCARPAFAAAHPGQALQAREPAAVQAAARAALLRDAEQALSAGPFSVTDKQRTAPSGDRRRLASK